METRFIYRGLWAAGATMVALLVMVIAIAAQSQDKKPVKKIITPVSVVDSLLPDTTQAKLNLLHTVAAMAEKAIEQDSIDLLKETAETRAMRKNSDALEALRKKRENEPIQSKSAQFTTNVIEYPDTLTIVIKSERKGIFKRRRE